MWISKPTFFAIVSTSKVGLFYINVYHDTSLASTEFDKIISPALMALHMSLQKSYENNC